MDFVHLIPKYKSKGQLMKSFIFVICLIFSSFLYGCSTTGVWTGASTYGGGDVNGVTVYLAEIHIDGAMQKEATLHCAKFNKIATLENCQNKWKCFFRCK